MTISKRHGSTLLEATIDGGTVTFTRYTGIGHRPSSNRKRHGYIPHVRAGLTVNKATFADNAIAVDMAKAYVSKGKIK